MSNKNTNWQKLVIFLNECISDGQLQHNLKVRKVLM